MLDYARQRTIEILRIPRKAVLATNGPAGLQIGEFPCEAIGLYLYLLVPSSSDHLFNLEQDASVTLLSDIWKLIGEAQLITPTPDIELEIIREPEAKWCKIIRVNPTQMHIRRERGWGYHETIEY